MDSLFKLYRGDFEEKSDCWRPSFQESKGRDTWIPVNYQFIRGKEIGISKAREEIFTMRKGIHYVIPFRDFNKFEFNSDNLSISSYLSINR